MQRKYFGTDGMRGVANLHPITPDIILRLALATGTHFRQNISQQRVVIGKDTRLSGYMVEGALVSGLLSMGFNIVETGPLPTPAIAQLTRSMRASFGMMISASHNPYQDNGIKLFGPDGYKLSDNDEYAIEALMDTQDFSYAAPEDLGRAHHMESARGRYVEYVKSTFPRGLSLDGLKIVVDCANGAAYRVAPEVLQELGAEIIALNTQPTGININDKCGATAPKAMQEKVLACGADVGLALDGDADRLIVSDEQGHLLDGDQVMGMMAQNLFNDNILKGPLVATVMSNLGLERFMQDKTGMVRTQVGDRYVVEYMRKHHCNLGGEASGHIIFGDFSTTGDGLIAALKALSVLVRAQKPMSEIGRVFTPVPQFIRNVDLRPESKKAQAILGEPQVQKLIAQVEKSLVGQGRLVIRGSGTQPLIRIMVEGDNQDKIESYADAIEDCLKKYLE